MFPLAHVVLGSGSVWAAGRLLARRPWPRRSESPNPDPPSGGGLIDFRLVAAGTLLADLVDKPLGVYVMRRRLGSGHVYAHTLLANAGLLLAGLALARRRRFGLLSLALGSLTHLVLDPIPPRALLWPLLGLRFPQERRLKDWGRRMLRLYFTNPWIVLSESASAVILAALAADLRRRGELERFLRSGWL